jgi:hypothetical protein
MSSSSRPSWAPGELDPPAELAQRDAGGVAGHVAGPGPQPRDRVRQRSRGELGEPCPQVIGAGQDQGAGLVDGLGPLVAGAALGDHQRADRLDRAVAALGRTGRPPGLRGPRGADSVQRIGLALAAAVLPVGAVHLHDPDAGAGQVPGQPGSVAARALHADQGYRPELAQPAQQAGVPQRRRRELAHPEQAADRVQRGGDVGVGVGVYPAGDGAPVFYDGHCRPFLSEGWHAPAGRRTREPRPLAQAGQIAPAAPVGAGLGPGRQIVSRTT